MTNTIDTQVQGKAVYMEFVKPGATHQLLLMPEGLSTSHKTVPMTLYRRRLTAAQPRKTWKAAGAHHTSMSLLTGAAPVSHEAAAEAMIGFLHPLFHSLKINDFKLYKQPIVVEVTAEDLELARQGKTPYKAMGRVWKVRKQLGFPKEYLHETF